MMWVMVFFFLCPPLVWADRVTIEKSTGRLIEYQSSAREGTLLQNALNAGYKAKDIEERDVTHEEWLALKARWIDAPAQAEKDAVEAERQAKEDASKQVLGLTDKQFQDLRDALR